MSHHNDKDWFNYFLPDIFVRHLSPPKKFHTTWGYRRTCFGKSHITSLQVRFFFFAFSDRISCNSADVDTMSISVRWRSPSNIWTHASICFSLCTSCTPCPGACYIQTVQRSFFCCLFERHDGRGENMLRSVDNGAIDCDLLEHTEIVGSSESAQHVKHIVFTRSSQSSKLLISMSQVGTHTHTHTHTHMQRAACKIERMRKRHREGSTVDFLCRYSHLQ